MTERRYTCPRCGATERFGYELPIGARVVCYGCELPFDAYPDMGLPGEAPGTDAQGPNRSKRR